MKLSFITPTKYIKEYGTQGDFLLALSHLIKLDEETEYEKAVKESGMKIYLDNGLFENKTPEPLEDLFKKAKKVGAVCVFAPDLLYDADGTRKLVEEAIKLRDEKYDELKIAAVVQANNWLEYMTLLEEFNENPGIDMIGLSILSVPHVYEPLLNEHNITEARLNLLQKMLTEEGRIKWKPVHLLGLGDSYKDVKYAAQYCPWVVSNDTSSAFWNAVQGKRINPDGSVEGGKTGVEVDFNTDQLSAETLALVQENINNVKELIYGTKS